MKSFTVILPPPPNALKPNHRVHWRKKAEAVAAYKAECSLAVRAALGRRKPPGWPRAVVQAVYQYHGTVPPDYDNVIACLKTAADALQLRGVILNDRHLLPLPPVILHGKPAQVTLLVDPCELTAEEIRALIILRENTP